MSFMFAGNPGAVIVHTGLFWLPDKAAIDHSVDASIMHATQLSRAETLRPSSLSLSLARGPGHIDFPLLCHCGSLFKHTSPDVRPLTAWHPQNNLLTVQSGITCERAYGAI